MKNGQRENDEVADIVDALDLVQHFILLDLLNVLLLGISDNVDRIVGPSTNLNVIF